MHPHYPQTSVWGVWVKSGGFGGGGWVERSARNAEPGRGGMAQVLEAALGRAFLFYPATSSLLSMIITCHLPIVSSSPDAYLVGSMQT